MKKALLALAIVSTNVFAYYEDPHQQFDMTRNIVDDFKIIFKQSNNVTAACDAESRKRGLGGIGYAVDACSFWNSSHSECVVITPKTANFHTIGHEVRHCLQGNWHK